MSKSRAWKLQLNLDEFNAGFAALDTEAERSEFLLGLSRGMNNGKVKDDCSDPMSVGFCLGQDMRGEAESFMEASSLAGKRSAEAKSNRIQAPCQPPTQPPCQGSFNQSTIHNLDIKDMVAMNSGDSIISMASNPSTIPLVTKKPKKPKTATSTEIPSHLVSDLETILARWPRVSIYDRGEVAKLPNTVGRPKDLYGRILKYCPGEEVDLMIKVALAYLDQLNQGKNSEGMTKYAQRLSNFFGEKAHWQKSLALVLDPEPIQPKMVFISTNPEA